LFMTASPLKVHNFPLPDWLSNGVDPEFCDFSVSPTTESSATVKSALCSWHLGDVSIGSTDVNRQEWVMVQNTSITRREHVNAQGVCECSLDCSGNQQVEHPQALAFVMHW
jgi:hypothetical protein